MSNPKILIADDDEDHRFILEEFIREAGFENIILAVNGKDALEKVERERPDIVLLDTHLGDANGLNLCRKMKSAHADMQIVCTTGDPRHVNFVKAKEVGADHYAVKTGSGDEIVMAIRKCAFVVKERYEKDRQEK